LRGGKEKRKEGNKSSLKRRRKEQKRRGETSALSYTQTNERKRNENQRNGHNSRKRVLSISETIPQEQGKSSSGQQDQHQKTKKGNTQLRNGNRRVEARTSENISSATSIDRDIRGREWFETWKKSSKERVNQKYEG
jgi:hypothetical protein